MINYNSLAVGDCLLRTLRVHGPEDTHRVAGILLTQQLDEWRITSGIIVRAMSPAGLYWSESLFFPDVVYVNAGDLIFTACRFEDRQAVDFCTDFDDPRVEETRLCATLMLPAGYNDGLALPFPAPRFVESRALFDLSEQRSVSELEAFLSDYLDRQKGVRAGTSSPSTCHLATADPKSREAFLDRLLDEVAGVTGSAAYAQFLARSQVGDDALVEQHIDAWRTSASPTAVQAYGEIVALDALLRPERVQSARRLEAIMASRRARPRRRVRRSPPPTSSSRSPAGGTPRPPSWRGRCATAAQARGPLRSNSSA